MYPLYYMFIVICVLFVLNFYVAHKESKTEGEYLQREKVHEKVKMFLRQKKINK